MRLRRGTTIATHGKQSVQYVAPSEGYAIKTNWTTIGWAFFHHVQSKSHGHNFKRFCEFATEHRSARIPIPFIVSKHYTKRTHVSLSSKWESKPNSIKIVGFCSLWGHPNATCQSQFSRIWEWWEVLCEVLTAPGCLHSSLVRQIFTQTGLLQQNLYLESRNG